MANRNYLIGHGERLVHPIQMPRQGGPKAHPYKFEEARERLTPSWREMSHRIENLPALACPNGQAAFAVTLHPAYLAKSYYPTNLLRELNLRAIGSRARHLIPKSRLTSGDRPSPPKKTRPEPAPEIFLAGAVQQFKSFVDNLPTWAPGETIQDDFRKIEDIRALDESRLKSIAGEEDSVPLEVVIHASDSLDDDFVIEGFRKFSDSLGIKVDLDQRIHAAGLCFLPLRAHRSILSKLVEFSFLRVIRRMPRLAFNEDILRSASVPGSFPVSLPNGPVINPDVKVAVFDGGVPKVPELEAWVERKEAPGVGTGSQILRRHGLAVTSALLFGPLTSDAPAPLPYAKVDHWRVLDNTTGVDDFELTKVLHRIMGVLRQRQYDFVNISIGPDIPIDDDEVHVWTAVLDEYLSNGRSVLTTAVGNTGDADWDSGNARIQPSADVVNGLGIGSADTNKANWMRASYSSIGPGRSPGFVKPDVVAFGGCDTEPFWMLDSDNPGLATGRYGTSYATPNALRTGVAIRAHFGSQLTPPAVRALMVHHADPKSHDRREVGWGRLPSEVDDFVICDDGEAHIIFQGTLEPSQWMRVPIPMPSGGVTSRITITATFCFCTKIDPEDALNYTRAGLDIRFRPNVSGPTGTTKRPDGTKVSRSMHKTKPFFRGAGYYTTEAERRADAHKWEATLKASGTFNPTTLARPVFDIEHQARVHGRPAGRRFDIPYALIVTVSAPKEPDLYNRILTAYRTQLEVLRPVIEVPVKIRR